MAVTVVVAVIVVVVVVVKRDDRYRFVTATVPEIVTARRPELRPLAPAAHWRD